MTFTWNIYRIEVLKCDIYISKNKEQNYYDFKWISKLKRIKLAYNVPMVIRKQKREIKAKCKHSSISLEHFALKLETRRKNRALFESNSAQILRDNPLSTSAFL